jgi:hypothetical protein
MADSHRPPVDLRQPSIEISCRFISRLLHDNINDHRQLYQSVCHLSAALYLVRPYEVVAILRALGGIIPDPASSNAYLHDILRRDFDTLSVVVNALTVGAFIIASEMAGRGLAYPPDFFNYGSRLGEEYALGQCLGIGKSFEPSEDQEMGRIVAKCYEYCPKFVMKFMGGVRTAYTSMLDGKRYSLGEGISGGLLGHVLMKSFSRTPTPALLNMAFSMST